MKKKVKIIELIRKNEENLKIVEDKESFESEMIKLSQSPSRELSMLVCFLVILSKSSRSDSINSLTSLLILSNLILVSCKESTDKSDSQVLKDESMSWNEMFEDLKRRFWDSRDLWKASLVASSRFFNSSDEMYGLLGACDEVIGDEKTFEVSQGPEVVYENESVLILLSSLLLVLLFAKGEVSVSEEEEESSIEISIDSIEEENGLIEFLGLASFDDFIGV